jgi:hypothetical protein
MASTVVIDELNADEKPNPGAYESLAKIQEEFWNHWTSLPRPFQKVFGLWFQPKVIWDVFSDWKKNSLQEKHFFTFYQHHFIPNYRNFEGHTTSTLPVNEAFWESGSLPLDAFESLEVGYGPAIAMARQIWSRKWMGKIFPWLLIFLGWGIWWSQSSFNLLTVFRAWAEYLASLGP